MALDQPVVSSSYERLNAAMYIASRCKERRRDASNVQLAEQGSFKLSTLDDDSDDETQSRAAVRGVDRGSASFRDISAFNM